MLSQSNPVAWIDSLYETLLTVRFTFFSSTTRFIFKPSFRNALMIKHVYFIVERRIGFGDGRGTVVEKK